MSNSIYYNHQLVELWAGDQPLGAKNSMFYTLFVFALYCIYTHSKFIVTCHYKHFKISTPTLKKLHWLPIKESITKSVFSHTKHLQINNLHISTIVFHFRHILFLHDLLIHLFFPFHMSDHHLAKELSLSPVHDSGIHSLLIPETRPLYQYSVPGLKHTFLKLRFLTRLFPISLDSSQILILAILILCPIE